MPVALTFFDGVRWHGTPVVGDRLQALLAALAAGGGRVVPDERLIDAVWAEDVPARATKALQVLVSRLRAVCGPGAVVRDGHGYRIGLPRDEVDTLRLDDLTDRARRALSSGDAMAARDAAVEAAALTGSLAAPDGAAAGPLAELRRAAAARATDADGLLGRALAETGDHAAALPRLEATSHRLPSDETVLACLLRSEAAVRGAAAALDRYERYRGELRDRLGTHPGEPLQRVHRDLLALDSPVRDGVRYDATALLGRADDVRRLSALLNSARVVSIVGPGGLGKTRLAHVLGRNSGRSVVQFLELVGVTAPEDLLGEVGSALGVRDSVSGRRSRTPAQRSDIRARIAQHLDRAPSLLILDNCEHIIEAVADLVAFLVATTRELRVLTTTRAPLAIAAERVYQLAQLGTVDAAELFAQRAVAARPDVVLEEPAVRDIVRRLDGLPLAIELAAAKVRAMSVDDIGRRLENRFALLRGGDRSAPDRHQTLLAVIDWSWNLLAEPERRALRRLSVFHDGFSLDAAEAVLGGDALAAVQSLADQSLVSVTESGSGAGVRYRMLETVREFGRMQLVDAGEDGDAHRAQRAWATAFARSHGSRLFGTDQFAAIDALGAEESNLADVLRQALAQPDPAAVVELLGGLCGFWSVRGDHIRVIVLAEAIVAAVAGWCPPRELEDLTRLALVSVLSNTMIVVDDRAGPARDLLARLGEGTDPRVSAMARVMLAWDTADGQPFPPSLERLADDPDRRVAGIALQWAGHARENAGDPEGAVAAAERSLALVEDEDGPWAAAILHTQIAQLAMQLGRRAEAERHARAALPVLERLGATDDLLQMRSLMTLAAIADGRLEKAAEQIARADRVDESETFFFGRVVQDLGVAELALARGEPGAGLATYLASVDRMRCLVFPGLPVTGLEPWLLFAESAALTALAHYGGPEHLARGRDLYASCVAKMSGVLAADHAYLDYPVAGTVLFALAGWGLLREAGSADPAVRLLVLAEGFAYNRTVPTMAWERIVPAAEDLAPGRIAALRAEYGERRGPELLDEARAVVEKLGG